MEKVSIIIPVKAINDYIRESMPHILALDYLDFEVIIYPDEPSDEHFDKTRIIPTGTEGPAEKRDKAIHDAQGEIIAFLDDDAYPRKDWLQKAVRHFKDLEIGAVGGPAVTPVDEELLRKASGCVFETRICGGPYTYRYRPGKKMFVDDFPSVNFIVRRDVFAKAGGFDSTYWPGEDTKLCMDIVHTLGYRIVYDPEVFVWHHRRKLFIDHAKQVARYALHRGHFAQTLPENSRRLSYFLPSLFVIGLITGPAAAHIWPGLWTPYWTVIAVYLITVILEPLLRYKKPVLSLLTTVGIVWTHLVYGLYFMKGLFSGKLTR